MSQQINLINSNFLLERKYFSMRAMLQALALLILGLVLFYAYVSHQIQMLEEHGVESARRLTVTQEKVASYAAGFSSQQTHPMLLDELARNEANLAAQQSLIEVLKNSLDGNATGYSEYMRAFSRQAVEGLWLTGFHISGNDKEIAIQGAVLKPELLPAYVRRLSREKIMRGKSFAALQMQQATKQDPHMTNYVEFLMQSTLHSERKP